MPAIDFAFLTNNKIIIHDIPKHKKNDHNITPSYSEQESVITEGMRLFFQEKIKNINRKYFFNVLFQRIYNKYNYYNSKMLYIKNLKKKLMNELK